MLRVDVYYRKDNGRKVSGVILVLGYLGFEFWIVWFLYEEGSFIFIFLFVLFFLFKVFGVFRSKWGRISWMYFLRGKKLNCDGILLFI